MEKKITQPLHPLTAMRRQYQELSGKTSAFKIRNQVTLIHLGQVNPSEMRRERTNYNVEQAQKKFQQDGEKTLNPNLFEAVFHSFFSDEIDFESNMESFDMGDHM